MKKRELKINGLYDFLNAIKNFELFIEFDNAITVLWSSDLVKKGIINLNESIMTNISKFLNIYALRFKGTVEYCEIVKHYKEFLNKLKCVESEKKEQFYNVSLIDLIMNNKLWPYQEVIFTKYFFGNDKISVEEKKNFLHKHINAIYNGSKNYSVINSLDKIEIDPKFFLEDFEYQRFMEWLIDNYVSDYAKRDKNDLNDYIRRLVYRNINRGYYILRRPFDEEIVYNYTYNLWIKDLRYMVLYNKLGITKDNCQRFVELINQALTDRCRETDISLGKYIDACERTNVIIEALLQVAEGNMKLTREE